MTEPLTQSEAEELAALRKEKAKAEKAESRPTHWLHLANGDVVTSRGTSTHVGSVPVIGSYEIPEDYETDE